MMLSYNCFTEGRFNDQKTSDKIKDPRSPDETRRPFHVHIFLLKYKISLKLKFCLIVYREVVMDYHQTITLGMEILFSQKIA